MRCNELVVIYSHLDLLQKANDLGVKLFNLTESELTYYAREHFEQLGYRLLDSEYRRFPGLLFVRVEMEGRVSNFVVQSMQRRIQDAKFDYRVFDALVVGILTELGLLDGAYVHRSSDDFIMTITKQWKETDDSPPLYIPLFHLFPNPFSVDTEELHNFGNEVYSLSRVLGIPTMTLNSAIGVVAANGQVVGPRVISVPVFPPSTPLQNYVVNEECKMIIDGKHDENFEYVHAGSKSCATNEISMKLRWSDDQIRKAVESGWKLAESYRGAFKAEDFANVKLYAKEWGLVSVTSPEEKSTTSPTPSWSIAISLISVFLCVV